MTHTNTTHCTTLAQARVAARQGRRWRLRLEFYGYNPENKSGHSEKYWQLDGEGATVTRRNGRFGARCKGTIVSLAKGLAKAAEKLGAGYRPVSAS